MHDVQTGAGPTPSSQLLLRAAPSLRQRVGATLFSNRTLDRISHLLDDLFRIPGTGIRFGLDGLIGLVPFAGDALAGLLSSFIIIAAWFRGAPPSLLARMLVNLALDVVVGSVPLLGDMFDIAWKANRRNFTLLQRHLAAPGRHRGRDWAFLLVVACSLLALLAAPLVVLGLLVAFLRHTLS